jgi:adenosylcobinamide kinase/adenosylcobinamide-phosphate guanylyltransferase
MKILYYGGQKSGKSHLAELHTLELAGNRKPLYIATYNNSYNDPEMAERIRRHRERRKENFITVEEPFNLPAAVLPGSCCLIDCLSMWILNNIENDENTLISQIEQLGKTDADIVFVLNNIGTGIIPPNQLSRKYVDYTGIAGIKTAEICDQVFEVTLGMKKRLK